MGNACCGDATVPSKYTAPEPPPPITVTDENVRERSTSDECLHSPENISKSPASMNGLTMTLPQGSTILFTPTDTAKAMVVWVCDSDGETIKDEQGRRMQRLCKPTDSSIYKSIYEEFEIVPMTQKNDDVEELVRDGDKQPILLLVPLQKLSTSELLRRRFSVYALGHCPDYLPLLDANGVPIIKNASNPYLAYAEGTDRPCSHISTLREQLRAASPPYNSNTLGPVLRAFKDFLVIKRPEGYVPVENQDGSPCMPNKNTVIHIHPTEELVRGIDNNPLYDEQERPMVRCIRKGAKRRLKQKIEQKTHVLVPVMKNNRAVYDDAGEPLLWMVAVQSLPQDDVQRRLDSEYVLYPSGMPVMDDQDKPLLKDEATALVIKNLEERDSDTEAEVVLGADGKGRLTPQHALAKRWRYPLYRRPTQQIVPWLEPDGQVSLDKDGYPMMGFLDKENLKEFWDVRARSSHVLGPNGKALKTADGTRITRKAAIVIKEDSDRFVMEMEYELCVEALKLVQDGTSERLHEIVKLLSADEEVQESESESDSSSNEDD